MKRKTTTKYGKKKEWREPYRKSKAFDSSCRCHGGCSYCLQNRTHSNEKRKQAADYNED